MPSFPSMWFQCPTITQAQMVVGSQAPSNLLNSRKTLAIGLLFSGTLTIAGGAAAAIVNGGSILAAFDEVGFTDNGVKRLQFDPRMAGALTGALMPSARTRQLLTALGAGVTTLREMVILFFGHPYQLDPGETGYTEQDAKSTLQAYVIPNASTGASAPAIATPGPGTVVLSGVTIEVTQYFALDIAQKALLRPFVEMRDFAIAAAGAGQELTLKTERFTRGHLFMPDSVQGGVRVTDATILTALAIRSDPRFLIGENPITINSLNWFNDQTQGEPFAATAFTFLNYQEYGRLARVIDPRIDKNLRALATANPSTVGGATNSRIRCAMMCLEAVAGVTADVVPFLPAA
jgi:hypothetical protein